MPPPENGGENDGWDGPRGNAKRLFRISNLGAWTRVGFLRWLSFLLLLFWLALSFNFSQEGVVQPKKASMSTFLFG